MNKIYRRIIFIFLLVSVVSVAVIYFTVDINTLMHLHDFNLWSVLGALLFSAIGLFFDGMRLMRLVKITGENITLMDAANVVFATYSVGGPIAQVMFLRRAGVPASKASVLVIVRILICLLFLLMCMPAIFYFDAGLVPWVSEGVLFILSSLIVLSFVGIVLLLKTRYLDYMVIGFSKSLGYRRRNRIFSVYRDCKHAVLLLFSCPKCVFGLFVESVISMMALYIVVPMLFIGLGLKFSFSQVIGRMMLLNLMQYLLPTPGSSGVSEGGFIMMFKQIVPPGTVGILAVAWRIIAEYLPMLVSLYFSIRVFGPDLVVKQVSEDN